MAKGCLYVLTLDLRFFRPLTTQTPDHAFSAGPRKCIGTRFGLAEAVAVLANIVYSYEMSLTPKTVKELKKMEERGANLAERQNWLCAWVPGCTRTPLRTQVLMRRRAAA